MEYDATTNYKRFSSSLVVAEKSMVYIAISGEIY